MDRIGTMTATRLPDRADEEDGQDSQDKEREGDEVPDVHTVILCLLRQSVK